MPDQLLPQPPPDASAPRTGEHAVRSRRKMRWLLGLGGVFAILLPLIIAVDTYRAKSAFKETENNIRELGAALREFDSAYGRFPDASIDPRESTGTVLTSGNGSSNELFKQLIIAEIAQSENMFYAKAKSTRRPDNVFNLDATALEYGECAFAYISGLSSKDAGDTPLVFGPVVPGRQNFDLGANNGKVMVVTVDSSLKIYPINSSGKIILPNGLELLDPRQPYWHGKAPDVKWPK